MARAKTTTEVGLGWRHQQAADTLHRGHVDGSPCDWCNRPMWKDRTRNYDYNPDSTNPHSGKLQADHSKLTRAEAIRQGQPIPLPDRLLHGECNRQRGEGHNDHLAANQTKTLPTSTDDIDTSTLSMSWPW